MGFLAKTSVQTHSQMQSHLLWRRLTRPSPSALWKRQNNSSGTASCKTDMLTAIAIHQGGHKATAIFPVTFENVPQLHAHFPSCPVLPAVLTLQAMFQLSASLTSPSQEVCRLIRASFHHRVTPHHGHLHLAVKRLQHGSFHAVATLPVTASNGNAQIAAEATFSHSSVDTPQPAQRMSSQSVSSPASKCTSIN